MVCIAQSLPDVSFTQDVVYSLGQGVTYDLNTLQYIFWKLIYEKVYHSYVSVEQSHTVFLRNITVGL
jgi:hypothetical protein